MKCLVGKNTLTAIHLVETCTNLYSRNSIRKLVQKRNLFVETLDRGTCIDEIVQGILELCDLGRQANLKELLESEELAT